MSELWESLCLEIQNNLADQKDNTIFRILLPNFDAYILQADVNEVIRFVKSVKVMARSTNCVVLISCEQQLLPQKLQTSLLAQADSVWSLTSFKDHPEMKIGEYDGTFRLLKQPSINVIVGYQAESDTFALKLKGKTGIQIEKIHLEPEEDRTAQDENLQQKGSKKSSVASTVCNPTKQHKVDF